MNWELFENVLTDGTHLAVLVVIPLTAVACAIALGVGVFMRRPAVATAAIMTAIVVGALAVAFDGSSPIIDGASGSVGSLVLLLPVSLGFAAVAGALPLLSRSIHSGAERAHRRPVENAMGDSAIGENRPTQLPVAAMVAPAMVSADAAEVVAA